MTTLDRNQSFAQIWGHNEAQYFQDGLFFNASGDQVEIPEDSDADSDTDSDTEEAFLRKTLSGGPVAQTLIKRESEKAGLNWLEIQNAAHSLRISIYQQRGQSFWKMVL